jgi:hypothetical protein
MVAALSLAASRVKMDRWHRYEYEVEPGKWRRARGVTEILNAKAKPALVRWAAKTQREADVETLFRLVRDGAPAGLSRPEWRARFMSESGDVLAHEAVSAQACDIGSEVHALVEAEVDKMLGRAPRFVAASDEAQFAFEGWSEWAREVGFRPVVAEVPVVCREFGYCGTFDVLAFIRGRLTLADWKTSSGLYDDYDLQNVAYRHAVDETFNGGAHLDPAPRMHGLLVRLPKDGSPIEERTVCETSGGEFDGGEYRRCFDVFVALALVAEWTKARDAAWKAQSRTRLSA